MVVSPVGGLTENWILWSEILESFYFGAMVDVAGAKTVSNGLSAGDHSSLPEAARSDSDQKRISEEAFSPNNCYKKAGG